MVHLDNGPIRRELSIALLNGPDPRGPVALLLQMLREQVAMNRPARRDDQAIDEPSHVLVMSNPLPLQREEAVALAQLFRMPAPCRWRGRTVCGARSDLKVFGSRDDFASYTVRTSHACCFNASAPLSSCGRVGNRDILEPPQRSQS